MNEFGDPTSIDTASLARNGFGMVSYGTPDNQKAIIFYRRSVLNRAKSQEGQPVYEGKDFVKIFDPGDKLTIIDKEAGDAEKQRYSRQWEQYRRGHEQIPDGIPVSLLFPANPEIVDLLRAHAIHTVQTLASLEAHSISTIGMGGQDWNNKAKAYLKQSEKGVDHHKFHKAIDEKDREIATLKRQVSELGNQVQGMIAAQRQQYQPQQIPVQFDHQVALINNTMKPDLPQPPVQFSSDIGVKKRGRPKGSVNKPKETS